MLEGIQRFYRETCAELGLLTAHVSYRKMEDARGLYVEHPLPRIYLDPDSYDDRTVWHEIFHHVRTDLDDGPEFEALLDDFIKLRGPLPSFARKPHNSNMETTKENFVVRAVRQVTEMGTRERNSLLCQLAVKDHLGILLPHEAMQLELIQEIRRNNGEIDRVLKGWAERPECDPRISQPVNA